MRGAAALPGLEHLRSAIATLGAQQRLRQAMIARPGHHLHRTLHRNIDWWPVSDAPFEPRALQIGKLFISWKVIADWKDNAAPRAFNRRHFDSCSMNEGFIRRIVLRH
jgi:hypothetical protein